MVTHLTNARLRSNTGQTYGEYFVPLDGPARLKKIEELRWEESVVRHEEPSLGWHLETRGQCGDWHNWNE
jgi:hypothetical protein